MVRHNEKTSAGRAKMSAGDTGDRLAEVDEVLRLVVQTVQTEGKVR